MSKPLIPEIRFKGFTDEWENKPLHKYGVFNPNSELPSTFEYVDLEAVVGTVMNSHRTENKDTAPSRAQRLAQKGDIFYQTVRPYQKNNFLFDMDADNFVFSTGYAQIRPIIDGAYLFSALQLDSFVNIVLLNCTGTSYPAINATVLSEINLPTTNSKIEQQKIGIFFSQLDSLIAEAERELERLEKMKLASHQKMFPRPGATTPEIRFKGFTGEWKKSIFGDICSFSHGQGYTKNDLRKSGVPIFLYGRLYTAYSSYVKAVDTFSFMTPFAITSKGNEVVMPSSGETAEDIAVASAILAPGIILGGGLNILYPNKNMDSVFLALMLTYGQPHYDVANRAQGKSVVHVYNDDIKKTSLLYPTLDEQLAIGEYFRNLDALITAKREKLSKLRNIKKSCLDKMFVNDTNQ